MIRKIADSELEVMRILWHEGRALSFAEIRTAIESKTDWKKSTIQTLLGRLRDKGIISAENHYVTLYSPNISEEEFIKEEEQHFIDKLFDGNAMKLAAALCRHGQLDERDVDELKEFFKIGGNDT
ncbi:MAG: BlaI/MecI/CopY family transcriptional regulator [Oscillospiraceae bacterium]|nr:BlaI/MecI/CopY family transcriptional regulator [Oscillospiraceae bacterium]